MDPAVNPRINTSMGPREIVRCLCGHQVFDGIVIKSRVVRLLPKGGGEALCRCKRWLAVPVTFEPLPIPIHGHPKVAAVA